MEKKLRIWDLTRASQSPSQQVNGSTSNGATTAASNEEDCSYEVGAGVHTNTIKSILWSALDSNIIITAADDRHVRWWDLRTSSPIGTFTTSGPIGSCELSTSTTSSAGTAATPNASNEGILSIAAGKSVHFFSSPTQPASYTTPTRSPTKPHLSPPTPPATASSRAAAAIHGSAFGIWRRERR